jgi:hypothetical protein
VATSLIVFPVTLAAEGVGLVQEQNAINRDVVMKKVLEEKKRENAINRAKEPKLILPKSKASPSLAPPPRRAKRPASPDTSEGPTCKYASSSKSKPEILLKKCKAPQPCSPPTVHKRLPRGTVRKQLLAAGLGLKIVFSVCLQLETLKPQ